MSLVYSRALTLFSAAILAILLPITLAGADPRRAAEQAPPVVVVTLPVSDRSPATTAPVEIIDALVIERVMPTDVIPQLPGVIPQLPDVSFDD